MANNREETERREKVIRLSRKLLTWIELEMMEGESSEFLMETNAQLIVQQLIKEFGPKE